MPINPSTDPALYNTGSLKCIRAGFAGKRGKVSFFVFFHLLLCVFYFAGQWSKDPALPAISTHTPSFHTLPSFPPPRWSLYSLANTLRWNESPLWCVQWHFPPLLTFYHLMSLSSHSSVPCWPPLWFPPPSCCNFTPILLSIYPPTSPFSTSSPSTAPSHAQGCRCVAG